VVMESSFEGHYLTADLVRANFNQWKIRNVSCGSSPDGLTKAFYTWALDEMTGSGEFHNPWVEGSYQDSPFLSQAFIQGLDDLMASNEPVIADPVFLAQDLPGRFNTGPCPQPDCALVNLEYGQGFIRQLRVQLIEEDGRLKIAGVTHPRTLESPEPAQAVPGVQHWVPFLDEQYGYGFRYPSGWTLKTDPVTNLHTPQDYPLMRSTVFSNPQSGSEFSPLIVDVVIGDRETALGMVPGELIEETQINGNTAALYHSDPGIISCVFQHPENPDVWLILNDPVSQFPGRETLAESVTGVFDAVLSTITFSQPPASD
jgi:hypothetical protein